jgi:hypothetical protein
MKLRKVRRTFSLTQLAKICVAKEQEFQKFGELVVAKKDHKWVDVKDRWYVYKDNGSEILAVAHLDSVSKETWCSIAKLGKSDAVVYSPSLDDRLGVYIITHLLPQLGINCDWLLTIGEEIGASTAAMFTTKKKYNWMFSFDRTGTDVVLYGYESAEVREMLRKYDFTIGNGSFSDIAVLHHLGCKGFNFGCGYRDYHSSRSHFYLSDMFKQVQRFAGFFKAKKDVMMPHAKKEYSYTSYHTSQEKYYQTAHEHIYCDWSKRQGSVYDEDSWYSTSQHNRHSRSTLTLPVVSKSLEKEKSEDKAIIINVDCPNCRLLTPYDPEQFPLNSCNYCQMDLDYDHNGGSETPTTIENQLTHISGALI